MAAALWIVVGGQVSMRPPFIQSPLTQLSIRAGCRGWHRRALLVLALTGVSGCSASPELPDVPREVVALAASYDHPSASLSSDNADAIMEYTRDLRQRLRILSGLKFVGSAVQDATNATAENQDSSVNLRGSITARTLCPGPDDASTDQAPRGSIEFTIGIENSQTQRAFRARMDQCRFQVETGAAATITAELQVDLGGRLGLAQPIRRDLLIRAANVAVSDLGGDAEDFELALIHFRLTRDSTLQALIDLDSLGIGLVGSVLLELAGDGSVALRGRNGAWRCGIGGDPCVPSS